MKNLAFFIFVILIMVSCIRTSQRTFIAFRVENKAGVSVKLRLNNMPNNRGSLKDTIIRLSNNEVWSYGSVYNIGMSQGRDFGRVDSALLVFNGIDEVLYVRNDTLPRNIFDINNYTGGEQKTKSPGDLFVFTYTITEEDYLNALN